MRSYIHENFLLETDVAADLYHRFAEGLPVLDFHCHLSPDWIADDHPFRSLGEIWLDGDHYKWRAMRTNGVAEHFCSGKASDWEKFEAWARTVPMTLGNPLYHWTHMELRFPFGIHDLLNPVTAKRIYDRAGEMLARPEFTVKGLLKQFNVSVVCTTDDPTDTLDPHRKIRESGLATRVFPTWRPDRVFFVEEGAEWNGWLDKLGVAAGIDVRNYDAMMTALERRHAVFHELGCRASDHGLEAIDALDYTDAQVRGIFDKARSGKPVTMEEARTFRSALIHELAVFDHARGWVQQFHLGALRNNNSRLMKTIGRDTGCDSIGDFEQARPLSRFLDRLDASEKLAKTILYNLNPRDNEVMATMIGNFQDGSQPGKMQHGSAWWFLDQKDGIEKQLLSLANLSLLPRFVGMVADSRSFLSFSRHEYFRRVLCNFLGNQIKAGLIPDDRDLVGEVVKDVSYRNADAYLGLPK